MAKTNIFEIVLLLVGISAAYLGFKFINALYLADGSLSWSMVIAVFLWLIMLLLFILMSLQVNVAKSLLVETQRTHALFEEKLYLINKFYTDRETSKKGKK